MNNKELIIEKIKNILKEIATEAEVMQNFSNNFATGNVENIVIELSFGKSPDELELYSAGDKDSTTGEFIINFESGTNNCSINGKFDFYSKMVASPEPEIGYGGATENEVNEIKLEGFYVDPKIESPNTMVIEKPETPDENIEVLIDKVILKHLKKRIAELILSKIQSDYMV